MKELIVPPKYDNKKLSNYLTCIFPNLHVNQIYMALRKKDIKVNGKRISDNIFVHSLDQIQVYLPDKKFGGMDKENQVSNLEIVYQDSYILIVNKPIGIEVTGENSLTTIVQKIIYKQAIACHRLDRNTSGLVVFAKTQQAYFILIDKFKKREIAKHYYTMVYGLVSKKEDTLISYLFKDRKKAMVYIKDTPQKGYQKIITKYTVLSQNKENNTTTLDVELQTGRTHQIRAHLAYIGYPIIGDGKYGANEINKKFHQKTQLLCSYMLQFDFQTDSGILNYLKGKKIKIEPNFK